MKIYHVLAFLLIGILSSCSNDSSIDQINNEDPIIETRRVNRGCPIGFFPFYELIPPVVGDDVTEPFGEGKAGLLDDLLNCRAVQSNAFCERICDDVSIDFLELEIFVDFTLWYDNPGFSAQDQLTVIQQLENLAINSAPICNGVPMTPIHYDVVSTFTVTGTEEEPGHIGHYNFSAIVTYESKCTGNSGDLGGSM